jgi:hypothetical protein
VQSIIANDQDDEKLPMMSQTARNFSHGKKSLLQTMSSRMDSHKDETRVKIRKVPNPKKKVSKDKDKTQKASNPKSKKEKNVLPAGSMFLSLKMIDAEMNIVNAMTNEI